MTTKFTFLKFVETAHPDEPIDHSDWATCAVGEYLRYTGQAPLDHSCQIKRGEREGFPTDEFEALFGVIGGDTSTCECYSTYGNLHEALKKIYG